MFQYVVLGFALNVGQIELERLFGPCKVVHQEVGDTFRRTTKTCGSVDLVLDVVEDLKNGIVQMNQSSLYGEYKKTIAIPKGCTMSKSLTASIPVTTVTCRKASNLFD